MLRKISDMILTTARVLLFLLFSIPFFLLIIVIPMIIKSERLSEIFCAYWFKMLFCVFGIKLYFKQEEKLPDGKFIVFSNHMSFLDIPAIVLALWGKRIKFVAKEGVLKYPVIGWGLRIQNHIIIKDGAESSSVRRILKAMGRPDVDCICIFPEGTRGRGPEQLLPFKKGVSFIFALAKKPLVPIAIIGTEKIYPVGSFIPRSGSIKVIIGRPMSYQDFTSFRDDPKFSREILVEKIREELLKLIKENL